MKIELDTDNSSKEELYHVAQMLFSMSGKKQSRNNSYGNSYADNSYSQESKPKNIFENNSPGLGMMSMFSDSSSGSSEESTPTESSASSNDMFSMFGDDSTSTVEEKKEDSEESPKIEILY